MKINCSRNDLVKGVNIVSKAVSTKTTMPILECILIDATTDVIKLTANDMELGIETIIEGSIPQRGMIALNAKLFSEMVKKLPDSNVTIEAPSDSIATIKSEKTIFNLAAFSGEDFSYLPDVEKGNTISLSEYTLKEVINQTIFSISDSETNKMMTGMLLEIEDSILQVVTLDGHRISIRNVELAYEYPYQKVIVPGKTMDEIRRIIKGDVDDRVDISFTDNHILFEFDQTTVVSRLIEGNYFNIEQMLSNDYETKIRVIKQDFLECIERAMLLVREGDKKPIIIDIGEDLMNIKIKSQIASLNEDITILKDGKDLLIGFNPKFLIEALRAIDDDEIDLYFMNSKTPCFIKDAEQTYIYLILPVNFSSVG
jgi:DNA polymerase-3 subunit beta